MKLMLRIIFIAYFFDIFQVFAIGSHGITFLELSILLFYLIFLKRVIWDGDILHLNIHIGIILLFVLAISSLISGIMPLLSSDSAQINQYLKSTSHFIFLILFTFILAVYPFEKDEIYKLIKIWIIAGLLLNIFGIYQIFARSFVLPLGWLPMNNVNLVSARTTSDIEIANQLSLKFGNFFRATSLFSEPSALAGFNLFLISFLFAPLLKNDYHYFKAKAITYIMIFISIITLFLTFSMGGVVMMFMLLFAMVVLNFNKNIKKLLIVLSIGAIFVFITDTIVSNYMEISLIDLFSQRISGIIFSNESKQISGESFNSRVSNFNISAEAWISNPIIGRGTGLTQFATNGVLMFTDYGFLAALIETGIMGALSFAGLYLYVFIYFIKYNKINKKYNYGKKFDIAMTGMPYFIIVLFAINFLWGNNFISTATWLPFGLIFALIKIKNKFDNKVFYEIKLMRLPLKTLLGKSISVYLKYFKQ